MSMTLRECLASGYDELRVVSERYLAREAWTEIAEPAELIGEMYAELARKAPCHFEDRAHFLRAARRSFLRKLSEYWPPIVVRRAPLEVCVHEPSHPRMLALMMAFESLERIRPRAAQVADLHLVGGLGVRETARELGVSEGTVVRDTRFARLFLKREMVRRLDLLLVSLV